MKVWMDGQLHDRETARIPVVDHGLLYGDGVFEGIRVHSGRLFRLSDHLARLARSAAAIQLGPLPSQDALAEIVVATARAEARPDVYLRLIVTRGDGPLGVDPTRCVGPRVICIADQLEIYADGGAGLSLVTSSVVRDPGGALDPRVKSLNYLPSVLAKREALARGADEALLLNRRGEVAEASVANVFAVLRGRVTTPPVAAGALEGITRSTVLREARMLGLETAEATLLPADLSRADELFLTGTGIRVMPVRELDGRPVASGVPGPITDKLCQAYRAATLREGLPL